jgi:hypothetical protein
MAHGYCMLHNYGCKHTFTICNTHCFSITMVPRTRLNVRLYVLQQWQNVTRGTRRSHSVADVDCCLRKYDIVLIGVCQRFGADFCLHLHNGPRTYSKVVDIKSPEIYVVICKYTWYHDNEDDYPEDGSSFEPRHLFSGPYCIILDKTCF